MNSMNWMLRTLALSASQPKRAARRSCKSNATARVCTSSICIVLCIRNTMPYLLRQLSTHKARLRLLLTTTAVVLLTRRKVVTPSVTCGAKHQGVPDISSLIKNYDFLASPGVEIVDHRSHNDFGRNIKFGVVHQHQRSEYCKVLDPDTWIECRNYEDFLSAPKNRSRSKHAREERHYCTSDSYLIQLTCAFVQSWVTSTEDASVAIFTARHTYTPYLSTSYMRTKSESKISREFKELAVAAVPTVGTIDHFAYGTLARVVWLLRSTHEGVPILVPVDASVRKHLKFLASIGLNVSRLVPFEEHQNAILLAHRLYFVAGWPNCFDRESPDTQHKLIEYPYELMDPLRQSYVPHYVSMFHSKSILVIRAWNETEGLRQHDDIVAALRFAFAGYSIEEYGVGMLHKPLHEHVRVFNRAAVVLGRQGPGFSNLVFCNPGTGVIEIGHDGPQVHMDAMHFRLAIGLRLRYWLILGKGRHDADLVVDVPDVVAAVRMAMEGKQPNYIR